MNTANQPDLDAINHLLLEQINPIPVNAEQHQALRTRLLQRVTDSKGKQANLITMRSRNGLWKTLAPGIRFKQLWTGCAGSSVFIEFDPGASLLPHRHHWLEEGIVLSGDLQIADIQLGPLDYHVSPPGSHHATISSNRGALAYLRGTSLGNTPAVVREVLNGLLPMGKSQSQSIYADSIQNWKSIADGIQQKILWNDGERCSCFYRLAAGARIPMHLHSIEEECLVLDGEVFLDDTLLCGGDYQLAPAGTQHDEVYTDIGALLFVRSAPL